MISSSKSTCWSRNASISIIVCPKLMFLSSSPRMTRTGDSPMCPSARTCFCDCHRFPRHSLLLCDVVTVRDKDLLGSLRHARELAGATPGTLETFLAVRGARTLSVRLERAQGNDLGPAHCKPFAGGCDALPGLASPPAHETAKRPLKGLGTIISFEVRGVCRSRGTRCVTDCDSFSTQTSI